MHISVFQIQSIYTVFEMQVSLFGSLMDMSEFES